MRRVGSMGRLSELVACVGLVAMLAGCDCGAAVQKVQPSLGPVPDELAFGPVAVGGRRTLMLTLTATTAAELKLAMAVREPVTPFSIEGALPEVIDPKGSVDVAVTFAPAARETYAATLVITTDDADPGRGRREVLLSGTGQDPRIEVTPGALSLSAVACPEGSTAAACSDTAIATLRSVGDVRLEVASVALRGVGDGLVPAGLSLARDVVATGLEAGGRLDIALVYRPLRADVTEAFDGSAELVVASNDPARPSVVVPVAVHARPNAPPVADLRVVEVTKRVYTRVAGQIRRSTVSVPAAEYTCADLSQGCTPGELQLRPGMKVRLSSAASADPEGDRIVTRWSLPQRPAESRAAPGAPSAVETDVDLDAVGRYEVWLAVVDGLGQSSSASLVLNAIPRDDLAVQLAWQDAPGADLDLHLLLDAGPGVTVPARPFCTQDCFFFNPSPAWMGTGPEDDPMLLRDDQGAAGQLESLSLAMAPAGSRFRVAVHAYDVTGAAPTPSVTLRLRGGETVRTLTAPGPLAGGDLWVVAIVEFPAVGAATVTPAQTVLEPTDSPLPAAGQYSAFAGDVGVCE